MTLLDVEAWERATSSVGVDVAPIARRANLLVRGLDLAASKERVLRVGEARIEIAGETLPCGQMEAAAPGLRAALEPEWRGGAYGVVLTGGSISVGDEIGWA